MFSKYRYTPPPPPYIVMSNSLYHLFRTLKGRCVSCMWSVRYLREERWQGKIVPGASSTGSLILYPVPSESSTNCTYIEYPQLQCILIHFSHTTAIPIIMVIVLSPPTPSTPLCSGLLSSHLRRPKMASCLLSIL